MLPSLSPRLAYERLDDLRAEADVARFAVRTARPRTFPLRFALTLLPWRSAAPRCCVAGAG